MPQNAVFHLYPFVMDDNKEDLAARIIGTCILILLFSVAIVFAISQSETLGRIKSEVAASWVQAIGSILAIFASIYFGHYAHRQQLLRDKRQQALFKQERVMILGNWFRQALAVDNLILKRCRNSEVEAWHGIKVSAMDRLEEIKSFPIFEAPSLAIMDHLVYAKQAATVYINWADAVMKEPERSVEARSKLIDYIESAIKVREEAVQHCDELAEEIQQQINKLS